MGQKGSTSNPKDTPSSTSSTNTNNTNVRSNNTNAALVNNFGGDYFPVGTDGATGQQTPRTSLMGNNNSNNNANTGRTPQSNNINPNATNSNADSAATPPPSLINKDASNNNNNQQQQTNTYGFFSQQKHSTKAPLCLRYKYQVPSRQPQAPQGNVKGQIPLPPPPQQGVAVDLFDGDGRHLATVPLNASEGEFFAVVPVQTPPAGDNRPLTQYFRFVVDGHRGVCHPHLPVAPMPSQTHSGMDQANFVHVFNTEEDSENSQQQQQQATAATNKDAAPNSGNNNNNNDDHDDSWSQITPAWEETRKFPPIMPPHLRYTPLNAPPSNIRILGDAANGTCAENNNSNGAKSSFSSPHQNTNSNMSSFSNPDSSNGGDQQHNNNKTSTSGNGLAITSEDDVNEAGENDSAFLARMIEGADQRPAPLSVTINHVYFQKREDHTLVGITTRYMNKCTSIAYYKHDPLPAGAVPLPMPLQR